LPDLHDYCICKYRLESSGFFDDSTVADWRVSSLEKGSSAASNLPVVIDRDFIVVIFGGSWSNSMPRQPDLDAVPRRNRMPPSKGHLLQSDRRPRRSTVESGSLEDGRFRPKPRRFRHRACLHLWWVPWFSQQV